MTQSPGGYPPMSEGSATQQPTARVARDEAADVAQSAREAGASVTGTAAEQARNVVEETRRQAGDLLGETRSQVRGQAHAQQRKAAQSLHTLASQLNDMAVNSGDSGMAAQLAAEASNRVHSVASWLDQREPGDLLDDVRDFARRRPGTFLLGAAVAGVLAGRMTRGVAAAAQAGQSRSPWQSAGAPADGPAPAISQPAETWPAPASGPAPVPSPDLEPGTGYGSNLPGDGYGSDLPGHGYPSDLPGDGYGSEDQGTDVGGDYSYRPGQP